MARVFAGSVAYQAEGSGPVVSIGNFDGMHLGHQSMLIELVNEAQRRETRSCVYTFEPAPRVVLAPHQVVPRISAWPDKVQLLAEFGVDDIVVERFTKAFAQHPPTWFAENILRRRLQAQAMVVGYDFRFGKARGGDVDRLRGLIPEIPITQVPAHSLDGHTVSSSAVREAIGQGDVALAATLLGRPHLIRGTVVPGDQRGRKMGFPTANLQVDAGIIPAGGVYAVQARVDAEGWLPSVANLGTRPTLAGDDRFVVEVHILEGSFDIYGSELEVQFIERVRDEQAFASIDELQSQIRADCERTRVLLGA